MHSINAGIAQGVGNAGESRALEEAWTRPGQGLNQDQK